MASDGRVNEPPQQQALPLVLIFHPLNPVFDGALSPKFRFLKPWESSTTTDQFLAAHADSITVILCIGPFPKVDADLMDSLPNLKCVVASSAGINHIDVAECRRRGVAVCNAGSSFSDDVADFAVGLVIDVLRGVSASDRYVRKGLWPIQGEFPLGSKLGGKRVGILGLGSIGSSVARRLQAFGCIISYYSRTKKPSAPYKYFSNVYDLAVNNNVLVVACALTPETHHIVNMDVMVALGKDGVIVNVGRGGLVDEKALVRCLTEGEIGGAGLDVYENEPCAPEELFGMDNVVLSHHQAFCTLDALSDVAQLVCGNLEAFFSGRSLLSPVLD